ncbi:MAG: NADPH:quinone reductase [Actinomycetota bacterium]|nr:NADPH:quinone reductase [Actinomycetota bacterium]
MMRAIVVETPGGPDRLQLRQVPVGEPGPQDLLVAAGAVGVNFIDVYHRSGVYPKPLPFVPGLEVAGTVLAMGEQVTGFRVGQRVATAGALGGYAEQVIVPAQQAVAVPEGVSDQQAAALMLQGITAHYLVTGCHEVARGETVLVQAAAGGVGLLLTQLATARGARVIATTSTEQKAELAREAGAWQVVGYDNFAQRVRKLTDGQGVQAVFDGVGGPTVDGSLACLRRRGTLVLFGAAGGPVPPIDPQRLSAAGSVFLTRPTIGDFTATREELLSRTDELFARLEDGTMRLRIEHTYPLALASRAHEDLQARRTTGKLLLLP